MSFRTRRLLQAGEEPAVRQTMSNTYYVYTVASRSRTLYTGVTNDLDRRVIQHRQGLASSFTAQYKIFRLVHFELFTDIHVAIDRETQLKAWRREKKIRLIETKNPTWTDLAAHLPENPKAGRSSDSRTREWSSDDKYPKQV
jgi:putative endonuclease